VAGTTFLDISYYFLLLPGPLGYWAQEGYRAEPFAVPSSIDATQQLAAGNLDFAQMGSAVIIQSNTEHAVPVRSLVTNFALGWGLAVKKDGPIKTAKDLKGKSIGLVSLGSTAVILIKSFVKSNGLGPENDVTLIATGVGAQALLALQSDRVQGLLYWSSALVGFQNKDPNLSIIKDPVWATLPDYSFATSERMIHEKPRMVEGITRGMVKAMVFAAANPDCARKLMWKYYPDSKPTGVDDAKAVSNDIAMISALLRDQASATALNPDGLFAAVSAKAMGAHQDLLFDAGLVTKKLDPASFIIGDGTTFWSKVNNFDKAAIEADAKACNY
jgi:NitT/TauT family transport system substrate-binding protein